MAQTPWLVLVKKVKAANPKLTLKEVLIKASLIYKKKSKL